VGHGQQARLLADALDQPDGAVVAAGSRSRSAAMVANSRSAPSSSRGGKNSNENSGSPRAKSESMRIRGW
jgi:hypothetical protein